MLRGPSRHSQDGEGAVFIYRLVCPMSGATRYIGKTNNPRLRLWFHLNQSKSHSHRCACWIKSLTRQGEAPRMVTICEVPTDVAWDTYERFFIASARHFEFPLTNSTDGGEGMKGISADAIERRKRSAAITNATPETQRRRAEAAARCYELRIRKTREALGTPENRLRAAEHSRTLWAKPEMKARKAATMKAAWADPIKAAARCAAISEGKRLGWARKKASLPA